MLKKISVLLMIIASFSQVILPDEDMQISVQAQKTKKVNVGIILVGPLVKELEHCGQRLKKDLEWSGQVHVLYHHLQELKHVSDVKKIVQDSCAAIVVISHQGEVFTWRLYDATMTTMLAGKKIEQHNVSVMLVAHMIADQVWPQLFGQKSSFASKISYSKQIWRTKYGKQKPYKQIWIADFDGSNAQVFVDTPTVNFSARWSNTLDCPLLFYSENTLSNVQLVMNNMFGNRRVVCSFDGLNMQPTFSDDGSKIVFCLSKDGASHLYLSYLDQVSKKRIFDRLTFNDGNNIAPCFVDEKHVAFVSDYKTHQPQIYLIDLQTKLVKPITDGGYCACPSYSKTRKKLVYSKMMGPVMQLFSYDPATHEHQQLTQGPGSKEEGRWSACGNYLVYGYNHGNVSRIAQLHVPTKTVRFLTHEHEHCTYPDCSPVYHEPIGILAK